MKVKIRVKRNKGTVAEVATPADVSTPIVSVSSIDNPFVEGF